MNKIKSLVLTLPAIILLILGVSTAAYARDGSGDNSANETSSSSSSSSGGSSDSSSSSNTTETEAENSAKTDAQEMLKDLRQAHKEHTVLERRKNCVAAEHGLETKLGNLGKNGDKYLARINKIFTAAQTYQKDNNVTVSNWDALVAAAQAAQTKATASVDALKALNVNLDCTSPTVADNVATFKAAAKQARTDLKSYKMAVKDILKALEAAKDQGGTQ